MLDTRVLVVDDEDRVRKQLARAAARECSQVDQAADGERAQQMFAQHHHPLVLLDLRLPKIDGIEVLRWMKQTSPASEVIIVSGHGDTRDVIEALRLRAFEYLEKPLDISKIENVLQKAHARYLKNQRVAAWEASDWSEADEIWMDEVSDDALRLYRQLDELLVQRDANPDDPILGEQYEATFNRLRVVQEEEAALAQRAFRSRLSLPRGDGRRTLEAARKELES